MRGFASRFSAFDDKDARASFAQRDGKREADDAAANDNDVPRFHVCILKEIAPERALQGQMTSRGRLHRMTAMKKLILVGAALVLIASASVASAQKDKDTEPTSWIYFTVVKDDNGKPVRNAAVILHAVATSGKQERGGMELKTSPDGKTDFDGIPYGMLRVQVLAHGFQTFGEDYDINKSKTEITIKLKRPQGQYSVYDDQKDSGAAPKQDSPPNANKPN